MGSKAPSNVTQTNTVKLSPDQQAIADAAAPYVKQYASTGLTLPGINVTDPTVLGFNPNEVAGQQAAISAANGQMTQLAQQAGATNSWLMNPALLSPDSNPFLAQQGHAVTQTATDNLLQNILPALRSGSVVSGGFNSGGNTREALAQGAAVGNTNKDISNALASLYGNAYQNGLQTLSTAVGQNPQVMAGLLAPASVVAGVGAQQRDLAQAQSNQNVNNANNQAALQAQLQWMQQQLPFMQAQQLYSLIGSMPGGTGVSTVSGASPSTNPFTGALGGAATGASIGSLIPGIGTTVGGGLGGILGLLGSL